MENNMVSLETAKKLYDAGWPKSGETEVETACVWARDIEGKYALRLTKDVVGRGAFPSWMAAPAAEDIAPQLPVFTLYKNAEGYLAACDDKDSFDTTGAGISISETLAALWLALRGGVKP